MILANQAITSYQAGSTIDSSRCWSIRRLELYCCSPWRTRRHDSCETVGSTAASDLVRRRCCHSHHPTARAGAALVAGTAGVDESERSIRRAADAGGACPGDLGFNGCDVAASTITPRPAWFRHACLHRLADRRGGNLAAGARCADSIVEISAALPRRR